MPVNILIKSDIKPDLLDKAISEIERICPIVRKEDGCISYNFFKSEDDATTIYTIECWTDQASLDSHNEQQHMKMFRENFRPTLNNFEVTRLVNIPLRDGTRS